MTRRYDTFSLSFAMYLCIIWPNFLLKDSCLNCKGAEPNLLPLFITEWKGATTQPFTWASKYTQLLSSHYIHNIIVISCSKSIIFLKLTNKQDQHQKLNASKAKAKEEDTKSPQSVKNVSPSLSFPFSKKLLKEWTLSSFYVRIRSNRTFCERICFYYIKGREKKSGGGSNSKFTLVSLKHVAKKQQKLN